MKNEDYNIFTNNGFHHPFTQESKKASRVKEQKALFVHPGGCQEEDDSNNSIVVIIIRYFGSRRFDLDNKATTILDCLVQAKKIEDDSVQKIGGVFALGLEVSSREQQGFDAIIISG